MTTTWVLIFWATNYFFTPSLRIPGVVDGFVSESACQIFASELKGKMFTENPDNQFGYACIRKCAENTRKD